MLHNQRWLLQKGQGKAAEQTAVESKNHGEPKFEQAQGGYNLATSDIKRAKKRCV